MKRVLLVTGYFPPCATSGTHRGVAFARHLPANGWQVAVIAPPSDTWEKNDPGLMRQVPRETRLHHVPYPEGIGARIAGRFAHYEQWLPPAWRCIRRVIADFQPDVLLTTSPPTSINYLGVLARRRFAIPWVADLRDPWTTNRPAGTKGPLQTGIDLWGEGLMMRHADLVLANTPSCRTGLQQQFPYAAEKIAVMTNGYDPIDLPARAKDPQQPGVVTLLHAGAFYLGRDPRPLMSVLGELDAARDPAMPRLRLKLLGRLDGNIDLAAYIRDNDLGHIVDAAGEVDHQQVMTAIADADILLAFQGPGYSNSIPAKLYEYLAAGKPILQLADPGGDIGWMLEKSGAAYRHVAQTDKPAIRRALADLTLIATTPADISRRPARVETFMRSSIVAELASHLDRLTGQRAALAAIA